MTEAETKTIIGTMIGKDGSIQGQLPSGEFFGEVLWETYELEAWLEGAFNPDQLEAIASHMRKTYRPPGEAK